MTVQFKDHFSAHAGCYATFRPNYPRALFDWLADEAPARNCAWDCATGNGQAALSLARRFTRVFASEGSSSLCGPRKYHYRTEPLNHQLAGRLGGLLTVAQAYHWFDHAAFVREARRVLVGQGLMAIWTYALAQVTAPVDEIVRKLYSQIIGSYWPPERKLVERGYRDFTFPWPDLVAPGFAIEHDWSLNSFEGYLRTWSAVQRYVAAEHDDPIQKVHPALLEAWGDGEKIRPVRWSLALRAFRV
jgi:hypothetical protein